MVRVAINGLGRIGRTVLKIALEKKIDVVAINDLTSPENLAYLLKYDSTYGVYPQKIGLEKGFITISGKKIRALSEKDPNKLPWKELKVDVVIESTGFFTTRPLAALHLKAGAKKVLISAPCKDDVMTVVPGVNETMLKKEHKVISVASCTTNCLAPIAKVLNDHFKIKKGFMTTIHAYTADQTLQDAPHHDFRRGRAANENLVPTTTGATISVEQVIPDLREKLKGLAIRAPVICGSLVDFVAELQKKTSPEELNRILKKAADTKLKGIMEYTEQPIVSSDIVGNSHSSIVDGLSTQVIDGNFVKVIAWYDNEFGYSNRMIDVLKIVKV